MTTICCRDPIQISATQRNRRKLSKVQKDLIHWGSISGCYFHWSVKSTDWGARVSFLGSHNGDRLRALKASHNQIRGVTAPHVPHPPGKQHPLKHPSPAPFPRGLPQGSNPGVSQALKDQAGRVPNWSGYLRLSSALPRTPAAGVLRLEEQLAAASLP